MKRHVAPSFSRIQPTTRQTRNQLPWAMLNTPTQRPAQLHQTATQETAKKKKTKKKKNEKKKNADVRSRGVTGWVSTAGATAERALLIRVVRVRVIVAHVRPFRKLTGTVDLVTRRKIKSGVSSNPTNAPLGVFFFPHGGSVISPVQQSPERTKRHQQACDRMVNGLSKNCTQHNTEEKKLNREHRNTRPKQHALLGLLARLCSDSLTANPTPATVNGGVRQQGSLVKASPEIGGMGT